MWRIVGVRVGLTRDDVEVEGVVVKGNAVLELRVSCCIHAVLMRMSQIDEANTVFHEYFNAGCCDMRSLSVVGVLRSAVDFFEKGHHRGLLRPCQHRRCFCLLPQAVSPQLRRR